MEWGPPQIHEYELLQLLAALLEMQSYLADIARFQARQNFPTDARWTDSHCHLESILQRTWREGPPQPDGATVAVAADPGLLPLPSSEDGVEPSPDLAEPSDSDTAARGDAFAVAAGSGLLPRPSSSLSPAAEAAELLAFA